MVMLQTYFLLIHIQIVWLNPFLKRMKRGLIDLATVFVALDDSENVLSHPPEHFNIV